MSSPVPSPVPAGTGEAESREPRWSNGEMDDPPPGCQHGYPRRCPADDPPADQTLEQTIDRAFNSDAQRYGTMVGVRRTAFAAGYRAALAAPSPASPAETREALADALQARADDLARFARSQDKSRSYGVRMGGVAEGWADAAEYVRAASPAVSLPGEQPGGQER